MKLANKLLKRVNRLFECILFYWYKLALRRKIDSPPVFIVGCGHSGTSVLLAILNSHPRIYSVPYETGIAFGDNILRFKAEQRNFDRLAMAARKRRWVEKTPKHILHIGKILKWQPNAKIILVLRDGRDVAYSIKNRTGRLDLGIKRWCKDNFAGRKYWGNPNVHVMKYENLISDFEGAIKGVLSFLGEEYYCEMKDFFKVKKKWYAEDLSKPENPYMKNHKQYRNWQINQPLFDGRARYKDLSADELNFIKREAGSLLVEFGYSEFDDEGEKC